MCPPDAFWEGERLSSLSRTELSRLSLHCQRCALCDARRQFIQPTERALEAATARVAAALLASVLLAAAMQFHPARRVVFEDVYAFLPSPDSVQRSLAEHAESEAAEGAQAEEVEVAGRVARRGSTGNPRVAAEMLKPVGPFRVFVEPQKNVPNLEPVKIAPPPAMANVRLELPNVPLGNPVLQPPRRSPIKKILNALGVPFRHI